MPIYEYECSQCAHRMETLQKISDSPLRDCPECGQPSLRKLVSAASFRLKGTGWYETDFKNKGKPEPADKQNKPKSQDAAKDGGNGKNDTKSDGAKSESKSKNGANNGAKSDAKNGAKGGKEPAKT